MEPQQLPVLNLSTPSGELGKRLLWNSITVFWTAALSVMSLGQSSSLLSHLVDALLFLTDLLPQFHQLFVMCLTVLLHLFLKGLTHLVGCCNTGLYTFTLLKLRQIQLLCMGTKRGLEGSAFFIFTVFMHKWQAQRKTVKHIPCARSLAHSSLSWSTLSSRWRFFWSTSFIDSWMVRILASCCTEHNKEVTAFLETSTTTEWYANSRRGSNNLQSYLLD